MISKTMIMPERKRLLTPPFAWIDRRFLFNGFLAELSYHENLLGVAENKSARKDFLSVAQ